MAETKHLPFPVGTIVKDIQIGSAGDFYEKCSDGWCRLDRNMQPVKYDINERDISFIKLARYQVTHRPKPTQTDTPDPQATGPQPNKELDSLCVAKCFRIIEGTPESLKSSINKWFDLMDKANSIGMEIAGLAKAGHCINTELVAEYNSLIEKINNSN